MVPSDKDAGQLVAKKYFYLVCFSCKWSSKDVDIPDQLTQTGGWREKETPNAARIEELIQHFKVVAHKDRLERETRIKRIPHKPITHHSHAIHLLDKYGISAQLSPKVTEALRAKTSISIPLSTSSSDLTKSMIAKSSNIEPAVATSNIEPLDINLYYKSTVDLNSVSTISQRLHQVECQPEKTSDFYPVSQTLSVKRSLRCRECERNLSKPEYNPSSIKFKILLAAYYHVPEVKIKSDLRKIKFVPETESSIELTICNPSPYKLTLLIEPSEATGAILRGNESPISVQLSPKDDMELDIDLNTPSGDKVEALAPNVTFMKNNKMGFKIYFTPTNEEKDEIVIQLNLQHDFVNTFIQISGSEKRETQIETINSKIFIRLPFVK